MKREKQIIENCGYLTHALTNEKGKVFGLISPCVINSWEKEGERFYWSDVFFTGWQCVIIRKGKLLVGITDKELSELHEQSKVNLSD